MKIETTNTDFSFINAITTISNYGLIKGYRIYKIGQEFKASCSVPERSSLLKIDDIIKISRKQWNNMGVRDRSSLLTMYTDIKVILGKREDNRPFYTLYTKIQHALRGLGFVKTSELIDNELRRLEILIKQHHSLYK